MARHKKTEAESYPLGMDFEDVRNPKTCGKWLEENSPLVFLDSYEYKNVGSPIKMATVVMGRKAARIHTRNAASPQEKEMVYTLLKKGYSSEEIAPLVGRSVASIGCMKAWLSPNLAKRRV